VHRESGATGVGRGQGAVHCLGEAAGNGQAEPNTAGGAVAESLEWLEHVLAVGAVHTRSAVDDITVEVVVV